MNSTMSGWSTRRMPMLAPRRVPPCLICSVAVLKMRRKETGPEATPPVEPTRLALGRRREKEKPVPPPDLWIMAANLTASKISSMESATGSTKQAESWPRGRPAFMRVGELGRKRQAGHQVVELAGQVVGGEGGTLVFGLLQRRWHWPHARRGHGASRCCHLLFCADSVSAAPLPCWA